MGTSNPDPSTQTVINTQTLNNTLTVINTQTLINTLTAINTQTVIPARFPYRHPREGGDPGSS